MAAYILSPGPWLQFFDANAVAASNGTASWFAAGSTTPINVYRDNIGTPWGPSTGIVPLDALGRATVYLQAGVSYKLILTDSLGASVRTQDNILATTVPSGPAFSVLYYASDGITIAGTGPGAIGSVLTGNGASAAPTFQPQDNGVNDFRLTLTTGVPITTADVTAATTLFCTPMGRGNRIAIPDTNGNPIIVTSAEVSIAVPNTASTVYSVFGILSAGVFALELQAWTNDTTPATALAISSVCGVWTKTGDLTRRFLGLMRTTGSSGQTEDSFAKRYVMNVNNDVSRPMRVTESTDSYTYSTATYRQARASTANQLDFVNPIPGRKLTTAVFGYATDSAAGQAQVSIGLDSTTTPITGVIGQDALANSTPVGIPSASVEIIPTIGRHTMVWLERSSAAGTTTWYGDNGDSTILQAGIWGCLNG